MPLSSGTSSLAPGPRFRGGDGEHHVAQRRDCEQSRRSHRPVGLLELACATTFRVHSTPEGPRLSPWVISTVSQSSEGMAAAAAWRKYAAAWRKYIVGCKLSP